ncbi:hypothetical protein [Virgisporangium aurantiacum]|uniref:Uncharacterized protein n=1 Tax=Virgisporangium aurantiacum TaxID=175570 RepID=A0A8J3Z3J9_9ACTN|nr:hypothetical protein [Virgisporangium aurantiacum]GIJ54365.1 hypothetical protein Vau01_018810 [Virgisporangium aurantiacum]
MTWPFRPPPALGLAADRADLGARELVVRGRRPIGSTLLRGTLGAGALVTAIAALAGVVWLAALGLPLAALGLVVYAYAVPPRGGHRWIAVHERGLVLSRPLAAVGWEDVGNDGDLLTAAVGDGRQVTFGPLTIDAGGRADERRPVRTLSAIVAGVVLLTGAGTVVAAARAADPAPPVAATPTETRTTPPAPVSTPPPSLPFDSSEWGEVCAFREFPAAAPYAGPGPHPIAFVVSGSRGPAFPSRPAAWEPPTIKATQLVACIDGVPGPVAGTCDYSDGVTGQLLHSKYEIKLYETRTRALVASFTLLGASTACSVIVMAPRSGSLAPQYTLVTEAQMRTAFAPYVEAPR